MAFLQKNEIQPELDKDEYIKKFIPLVLEIAPKNDSFSVYNLHKNLSLNENELNHFKSLDHNIKVFLVENKYANFDGSSKIKLTEKGINYFEDEDKKELEKRILILTDENLDLQNKELKRYVLYSILSFIAGAIITNIKDILTLLSITTQE